MANRWSNIQLVLPVFQVQWILLPHNPFSKRVSYHRCYTNKLSFPNAIHHVLYYNNYIQYNYYKNTVTTNTFSYLVFFCNVLLWMSVYRFISNTNYYIFYAKPKSVNTFLFTDFIFFRNIQKDFDLNNCKVG